MIFVTHTIQLGDTEIQEKFIRASGPGGQNVNKVASAVQLRFDVINSPSISDYVRRRLVRLAGNRLTRDGTIVITASQYRTQDRNRRDALDRLIGLIREAAVPLKHRRTRPPSRASKEKRLHNKRQRSTLKNTRSRITDP